MSITSQASHELYRSEPEWVKQHSREIAAQSFAKIDQTNGMTPQQLEAYKQLVEDAASAEPIQQGQTSTLVDALVRLIPTEAISLYLLFSSFLVQFNQTIEWWSNRVLFFIAVGFTPVLFILIYLNKRREVRGIKTWPGVRKLPWLHIIASTVAFSFWANTLPSRPFFVSEAGGAVAGALATLMAFVLPLIVGVFERKDA